MRFWIFAFVLAACQPVSDAEHAPAVTPPAAPAPAPDFASVFGDTTGTFVLLWTPTGDTLRHDPARAAVRTLPASTFKIPNALAALTFGVARDTTEAFPYDAARDPSQRWWPDGWAQDQTLATAFRRSSVWTFREIARRLGPAQMQAWLDTLSYGNRTIGAPDGFWLDGSLRISPDEQVAFLDRLFAGTLPAPADAQARVRGLMRLTETPEYTLYGKTGTGYDGDTEYGWLVGALEAQGRFYPYALRMEGPRGAVWSRAHRLDRTLELFRRAGLVP